MILWFNKFCTEPLQVYEHLSNCRGDHTAMWAPGFTAFAGSLSAVGRLLPRAPLSSLDATHFRCRCSTWCWEAVPACYCSAGLLWPHIMVGPYRWWSSEVDSLCSMCAGVYARMWTCIWMPEDDLQGRCFLLETGSLTVLGIAKQTRLAGRPAQVIQPSLVSISLALGLWL